MGGMPASGLNLAGAFDSSIQGATVTADSTEQRDLDMTGITSAEVASFNGDVTVEAGAERPRLAVTLRGKTTYQAERLGSLLYVVARKRGLTYFGSGASFHLWVPVGLTLKLATVGGAIRVHGGVRTLHASAVNGSIEVRSAGQADLHLSTSPGSVEVRGAHGRLKISTINGPLRLAEVEGQIEASAVNAPVEIAQARGRIKVGNSNGAIVVTDAIGQIQAATGVGGIRLERVTFEPGTSSWAKTGFGAVEALAVQAPGGLRIHARAHTRPIQADLPGYDIRYGRDHLRAHLAGPNPAHLDLATPSEIHITV
jgi:hypothetical protein